MKRMAAISAVTFSPGRMPPLPGFAPWDSLISNMRTFSLSATAFRRSSESPPSGSRTPYLAVPIWNTMSAPPSKCIGDSAPSPVFIHTPALRAPLDKAVTAGRRYRAVAHSRNIEHRGCRIWILAVRTDGDIRGVHCVGFQCRVGAVDEDDRAHRFQVPGRTERRHGVLALGGAVYPTALGAIEGHLLPVHGEEVLAEELAERLEQITESSDDRKVPSHRLFGLGAVDDVTARRQPARQCRWPPRNSSARNSSRLYTKHSPSARSTNHLDHALARR